MRSNDESDTLNDRPEAPGKGPGRSTRKPEWTRGMIDMHRSDIEEAFDASGAALGYVFGSLARGREADRKAISDLDIAVVFRENTSKEERTSAWYSLRAALEHTFEREDFDLVVANDASAALRFRIMRDRDLIYMSDPSALARFESEARREWNDMQYYRKMQRAALERRYQERS